MDQEDEMNVSEDENKVRRRINKQVKRQAPYRTRFDVLATPHKRNILGTYQSHAYHFPKEKVEKLKRRLQELFAMTPEETEKYFEQMRSEANEIAKRKMMKIMLKRLYQKQQRAKQEQKAYKFIAKFLKQRMMYGFTNPIPPLISVRLRNLSDIILEQICDLRNIDIPDRDTPNQHALFLIALADWTAIAIEQVYYAVQLKKNEELEAIEEQAAEVKQKEKKTEKKEEKITDKEKKKSEIIQGGEDFDLLEPDLE